MRYLLGDLPLWAIITHEKENATGNASHPPNNLLGEPRHALNNLAQVVAAYVDVVFQDIESGITLPQFRLSDETPKGEVWRYPA